MTLKMILCDLCKDTADRSYIISLKDRAGKIEIAGCKDCITDLTSKVKSYEDRSKYSVEKMLGLLGLGDREFEVVKLRK